MSGQVRVEFDVKSQKGLQEFDKLNKKQQRAVILGSKMGKEFEKMGRKASKVGKTSSNAFSSLSKNMVASIDVVSLFTKGLQIANSELERTKKLNRDAFSKQGDITSAIGSLIGNAGFDKKQVQKVIKEVAAISVETGLPQSSLIDAVTGAVSGAGASNFTVQQIVGALRESAYTGAIDREINLGELSSANLRLQKVGFSETEASNFAKIFVQQFGGKLNEAVEKFPELLGTFQGVEKFEKNRFGKSFTKKEDIFALFGALTQGPVPDVKKAANLSQNLFSKVNTSGFDFKSKGTLDRLIEIANAIKTGQIADKDIVSTFTKSGAEGAQGLGVFSFLADARKDLTKRQEGLSSVAGSNVKLSREQFNLLQSIPQAAIQQKVKVSERQKEIAQFQDIEGAQRSASVQALKNERDAARLGFFDDPTAAIRDALVETGFLTEESARELLRSEISAKQDPGAVSAGTPTRDLVIALWTLIGDLRADRKDRDVKQLITPAGEGQ